MSDPITERIKEVVGSLKKGESRQINVFPAGVCSVRYTASVEAKRLGYSIKVTNHGADVLINRLL